jgi:hypothetical protein
VFFTRHIFFDFDKPALWVCLVMGIRQSKEENISLEQRKPKRGVRDTVIWEDLEGV